jgi:hypothetical protein
MKAYGGVDVYIHNIIFYIPVAFMYLVYLYIFQYFNNFNNVLYI